jgi:adenosylcobinamide-phosphate synthase
MGESFAAIAEYGFDSPMGCAPMTAQQLVIAYSMDLLLGDPEWFPHPVRLFGSLTNMGERVLRRHVSAPKGELAAGAVLTASVVSLGWVIGQPKLAAWRVILAWTGLATRSLLSEAASVLRAMEADDLELARSRLSRIVGRDTETLDESEICRAVIETLAESACDGIVAPLFWLAAAGVSGMMAYKATNTLDSMIGHREAPYLYFGRVAARLDDAASFIPARLTALGIVAAAYLLRQDAERSWHVWLRDGDLHASPNAGQSEAAMAGALGVRLGGTNIYAGVPHRGPLLNSEGSAASIGAARTALSLVAVVSALGFFVTLLVRRRP